MTPFNLSTDPSKEALKHGMAVEPENRKVQCCYCGIVVPGFNPLQDHLGGIPGNIAECPDVPEDVKEYFRSILLAFKVSPFMKEVGNLNEPGSSSKRRCTSNGRFQINDTNVLCPRPLTGLASFSNGWSTGLGACSSKDGLNSASIAGKRSVGRFFFENAIDFSAVTSPSFQNMMGFIPNKDDVIDSIPRIAELEGWILEEELIDIENYVKQIRLSWPRTGCSILLDGWTDQSGRDLINVIVDCPEGPTYLSSVDVSPSKGDDALFLFLESVLEEVGISNVVQIVAHKWSDRLEAIGDKLFQKYKSLFWTVSATRCLSLILEKFAKSPLINVTLEKAKTITRFIYSDSEALKLLRRYIDRKDLVRPSKIKAATPFLTLENFVFEKSNLKRMCKSSEWLGSRWASSDEGKRVTHLISLKSFWRDVTTVVRVSIPLVKAMALINGEGEPLIGFIYELMDQIKETIMEELGNKKSTHIRYWKMIDVIWNEILHSAVHASSHYLNPKYYFSSNFYSDPEVVSGLMITIVVMSNDHCTRDMVSRQFDLYRCHAGDFNLGVGSKDRLSPADWWARWGSRCPDLQKLAIRLHSQKCNGAECYELRRDVAEKLLSDTPRNAIEQQKLLNFTYLHYNLKLKQFKLRLKFNIEADKIDPTDDWIVAETHQANVLCPESGSRVRTGSGSGCGKLKEGGPSRTDPNILADQIDPTDNWIVAGTHQANIMWPESGPRVRTGSGSGRGELKKGGPSCVLLRTNPNIQADKIDPTEDRIVAGTHQANVVWPESGPHVGTGTGSGHGELKKGGPSSVLLRTDPNILANQIDPTDSWIVPGTYQANVVWPESGSRVRTGSGSGRGKFKKGGPSSVPSRMGPKRKA